MIRRDFNLAFLFVTLVIATSDALLVWVNYRAAKNALHQNLAERGQQLQDSFHITLAQVGSFMRQTATYIGNDERVSHLFMSGRQAVEREGGGAGGPEAAAIRKELFGVVSKGWKEMTRNYKGRQLHFHLPPDVSFLRVHRPEKFGDDLSAIRHTITTANTRLIPTTGFESGRVYAGIRGVVPVFVTDPQSNRREHVGAVEAGTSFSLMLSQLKNVLSADYLVLMTLRHARETMWPEFLEEYTKVHPVIADHMLEATTDLSQANRLMENPMVSGILGRQATVLVDFDGTPTAVTSFPLRDYLGNVDPQRDDIGSVLVWTDAQSEVNAFDRALRNSLLVAIIGFLLIESLIFWGMRSSSQLRRQREAALTDGLTGIPNRRCFEDTLSREVARARRRNDNLAILLCDIDFFKQYNDTQGHLEGDECLRTIAATLQHQLRREGEFLARYGGEEFVVILPSVDRDSAIEQAERLRRAVEALNIQCDDHSINRRVTISCGVASARFESRDDTQGRSLLEQADRALYTAKAEGRNRSVAL